MKFKTGRQLGLGNRNYTLTEEFNFFGRVLPEGLTVDGSSVPKVPILFLGAFILIFFDLNRTIEQSIIFILLLVGICESSGWFMKPAAVHDYRFQNASSIFGWFSANVEYLILMLKKVLQYSKEKKDKPNFVLIIFHTSMGFLIAFSHFLVLTMFGWFVWYSYYFRNKKAKKISNTEQI